MKRIVTITLLYLSMAMQAPCNTVPSELVTAFSNGDAAAVSEFFNATLELTLFDKEEIYSKTQAERILDDFFKKNTPTEFKLIHQGGKETSKYAIGNLTTHDKTYRITFLLKSSGNTVFIHQLRIEEGNE